jgi:hypothetical protein
MTFGLLRVVAVLKRIAKALEDRNEIERERVMPNRPLRPTAKFSFSRPTVDEWNQRHAGVPRGEEDRDN